MKRRGLERKRIKKREYSKLILSCKGGGGLRQRNRRVEREKERESIERESVFEREREMGIEIDR